MNKRNGGGGPSVTVRLDSPQTQSDDEMGIQSVKIVVDLTVIHRVIWLMCSPLVFNLLLLLGVWCEAVDHHGAIQIQAKQISSCLAPTFISCWHTP